MNGSPNNQELCWQSTQAMLNDLNSDGPAPHEATAPAEIERPEPGEDYGQPVAAGPAPVEDAGDDDTETAEHRAASPRPDAAPVDVDAPSDTDPDLSNDSAEEPSFHTPVSDDHRGGELADSDETSLPGSELVDQLIHPAGAGDDAANPPGPARAPRYNKRIAGAFAAATAVAALVASGAMLSMRSGPHTNNPAQPAQSSARLSVVAAPPPTTSAADNQDATIPYTATSVGCLPGSTAAQSVAGPDSTQAWVCVTGGNIGQYLVLNLGRSMVITAVCITPGWVGADASGADQWHQHRVLTRVQWSFNDAPPTVVPQETGSVHGEACKPMPARGVLASKIILLIQETGRAPADATPTSAAPGGGGGGLIGDVLGPPVTPAEPTPTSNTPALPGMPADQSHTDPADNTFAVSSIKISGHPPQ